MSYSNFVLNWNDALLNGVGIIEPVVFETAEKNYKSNTGLIILFVILAILLITGAGLGIGLSKREKHG